MSYWNTYRLGVVPVNDFHNWAKRWDCWSENPKDLAARISQLKDDRFVDFSDLAETY